MLSLEQLEELKQGLNERLGKIFLSTHAVVDAEYIRLCMQIDKLRKGEHYRALAPDLRTMKKTVEIELDLDAIEILSSLCRIQEHTYGKCTACDADIPIEELALNPSEELCTPCRVRHKALVRN
jgi:RNA polymerase-binding transcription factor DksA